MHAKCATHLSAGFYNHNLNKVNLKITAKTNVGLPVAHPTRPTR